jgi:hypothetical protein
MMFVDVLFFGKTMSSIHLDYIRQPSDTAKIVGIIILLIGLIVMAVSLRGGEEAT